MRFAGVFSALTCAGAGVILSSGDASVFPAWLGPTLIVVAATVLVLSLLARALSETFLRRLKLFEVLSIRVLTPIVFGILTVVLYEFVERNSLLDAIGFQPESNADSLIVEIFSGTISTIYALIVAFLVFKSMQDHDNINFVLRDEAMHLDSISQFLPYFNGEASAQNAPVIRDIQKELAQYARNIASPIFKRLLQMNENQKIIDNIVEDVGRIETKDAHDESTLNHIMARIDSLASVRARRIAYMMSKPSPFMIIMLFVLSVFIVAPFFVTGIQVDTGQTSGSVPMTQLILWFLGFSLTFLFLMMVDMASHFDGYWEVKRDVFVDVAERIDKRLVASD